MVGAEERESSLEEEDRMGEDGYPLIADVASSSHRSRHLARLAGIDRVIDQQAFDQVFLLSSPNNDKQELVDELGGVAVEEGRDESPPGEEEAQNPRPPGPPRNALL